MSNPSQTPNVTRPGTFDKRKQYTNARFQQGTPVLDVDLNDAQDYIAYQANLIHQDLLGYAAQPSNYTDFSTRPVTRASLSGGGAEGDHPRNADNVAYTLGRLQCRLGVVDSLALQDPNLFDFITYDYFKIESTGSDLPEDHQYGNYILSGKVTAGGSGTDIALTDENKMFTADHRLLGWSDTVLVPGTGGAVVGSPVDPALPDGVINDCELVLQEEPCRILFHSIGGVPQNPPVERIITNVSSSTTLEWDPGIPLAAPLNTGDEYTIVPGNQLTKYRNDWDSASNFTESLGFAGGLGSAAGTCLHYLHVFHEDVSSDEDTDLEDPNLGMETTHRTQLRYCYRIMQLRISNVLDPGRDFIEPIHAYNLLTNKNGGLGVESNIDRISDVPKGPAGTIMDGFDLLSGWASGTIPVAKMDDRNWTGAISRHQLLQGGTEQLTEFIRAFVAGVVDTLTAEPTKFQAIPLLWEAACSKDPTGTFPGQTLSSYWYPNLDGDVGAEIHARLAFTTPLVPSMANTGMPPFAWALRTPQVQSPINTGFEVFQSRRLSYYASGVDGLHVLTGGPDRPLLTETRTSVQPNLLFNSIDHHLTWLDSIVLGSNSLGNEMAQSSPAGKVANTWQTGPDGATYMTLPTNMNLFFGNPEAAGAEAPGGTPLMGAGAAIHEGFRFDGRRYNLNWDPTYGSGAGAGDYRDRLAGQVFPLDVLSGPGTPTDENGNPPMWNDGATMTLVRGPGSYVTRNMDITTESITAGSVAGWGFYAEEANDEYNLSLAGARSLNFRTRQWHEGIGQATKFQDSLNFRKLAIKTQAHKEMDMFTLAVKPPILATQWNATVDMQTANKIGGSGPRDYLEPDGVGFCNIGMYQDPTLKFGGGDANEWGETFPGWGQCTTDNASWAGLVGYPHRTAPNSYRLGGVEDYLGNGVGEWLRGAPPWAASQNNADSPQGNVWSIGDMASSHPMSLWWSNGGHVAYEAMWWTDETVGQDEGQFSQAGMVKMNLELGPWSRWELQPDPSGTGIFQDYSMKDQWENRCTAMRVRYHIGDFYPGPQAVAVDDSPIDGLYHNALVDTLNMHVQFEPLSLAHWMTMPKHQHSILEGSFMFAEGLSEALNYISNELKTDQYLDGSDNPLVLDKSPILGDARAEEHLNSGSSFDVGDVDPYNLPFGHQHQLYVHWYHPHMDKLSAPFWQDTSTGQEAGYLEGNPQAGSGSPKGSPPNVNRPVPYSIFGERSLVSTGGVYNRDQRWFWDVVYHNFQPYASNPTILYAADTTAGSGTTFPPNNSFQTNTEGQPNDYQNQDSTFGLPANTGEWYLGSHRPPYEIGQGGGAVYYTGTVQWGDDNTLTVNTFSEDTGFPFIPRDRWSAWEDDYYPGPVILPAFRAFAYDEVNSSGFQPDENGGHFPHYYGMNQYFRSSVENRFSPPSSDPDRYTHDWKYWPNHDAAFYSDYGVQWGTMDQHQFPVLRAAIRTDTLVAIGESLQYRWALGELNQPNPSVPATNVGDMIGVSDEMPYMNPAHGPDKTFDSLFVGDVGTTISLDSTAIMQRVQYTNPLVLGVPMRRGGAHPGDNPVGGPTFNADIRDHVFRDIFELQNYERAQGATQSDPTKAVKFLPLINTFLLLENQGLQQKLLWNCSFRVMHARPGGGYRMTGITDTRLKVASQPKSLTELFIIRDRTMGKDVPLPAAPTSTNKPFLHFESIHPIAGGSAPTYNQHPNNPYIGHLYGMIMDTVGGSALGQPVDSDNLYDESPTNQVPGPGTLIQDWFRTGVGGDCFVGDPFDYEYSKFTADSLGYSNQVPKRDRLAANSGLEMDLLNELRYAWVPDNANSLGLAAPGTFGKSWLDMMPHPAEMTQPGDHEIVFVLYPGGYGHKMIDDSVPTGYNANAAGCHASCTVEVNRASDRRSSSVDPNAETYGIDIDAYNILSS